MGRKVKKWRPFRAKMAAAPSMGVGKKLKKRNGDPGQIRTADLQFRKLLLYPPELRGHVYYERLTYIVKISNSLSLTGHTMNAGLDTHAIAQKGEDESESEENTISTG